MNDDDDSFEIEMTGPGEDSAGAGNQSSPSMWCRSPCVNFVEHEILEMSYLEPVLGYEIEFVDTDDNPTPQQPAAPSVSALINIGSQMAAHYAEHISLARSLGSGSGVSWQTYIDACHREGMTPIKRRHT